MATTTLSLAGLHLHGAEGPWRRGVRASIEWAAGLGFRSLHLDATAPGVRARELDRSGRRDLAATLRRSSLGFTGLDLWIPPDHFAGANTADRALDALLGAIEMACELAPLVGTSTPVVSVTLPAGFAGTNEVASRADAAGVWVEDFSLVTGERVGGDPGVSGIRPGLDTGRLLMRDAPPGKTFAKLAKELATLRLNDADDTGRRVFGRGRLDPAMLLALHATLTPGLPIVTDLRGLDDPARGAEAALNAIESDPFAG